MATVMLEQKRNKLGHSVQREGVTCAEASRWFADYQPDESEVRAAALQFVRKISGYRHPSQVNTAAFDAAVDEIAAVSRTLLSSLTQRPSAA